MPTLPVGARAALAGLCIAGSVPPWGWWPLSFVGFAILDRLLVDTTWQQRFRRTWLVCAFWLFPARLWMLDLTPPGYVVAAVLYAAYYAVAAAVSPADDRRRIVFPWPSRWPNWLGGTGRSAGFPWPTSRWPTPMLRWGRPPGCWARSS